MDDEAVIIKLRKKFALYRAKSGRYPTSWAVTAKELDCVERVLKVRAFKLQGTTFLWCDNKNRLLLYGVGLYEKKKRHK